jgi:hypothetical protein
MPAHKKTKKKVKKKLSPKQKKIAGVATPKNMITKADFAGLRRKKK